MNLKIKNILLIAIFIISSITNAQKTNADIYLKNGKMISGLIKITGDQLKLFKENGSKGEIILKKTLDKIIIHKESYDKYLYSILVEKSAKYAEYKLLEKVISGKTTLYKNEMRSLGLSTVHTGGMNFEDDSSDKYFVIRDGEKFAKFIGYNGIIKNKALKYFADCDNFLVKMKDKKFRKQKPELIIHYYNENCLK